MRYVQTNNGDFVRHIYNEFASIRWDERTKMPARKLTEDQRIEFGVFRLQLVTPDAYDPHTQKRVEVDSVLTNGQWVQVWEVVDLDSDQLETQVIAASKAARANRDVLLSKTDWNAMSDITMSPEMAIYRQALRDVPQQIGFPYNIAWPEL